MRGSCIIILSFLLLLVNSEHLEYLEYPDYSEYLDHFEDFEYPENPDAPEDPEHLSVYEKCCGTCLTSPNNETICSHNDECIIHHEDCHDMLKDIFMNCSQDDDPETWEQFINSNCIIEYSANREEYSTWCRWEDIIGTC